MIDDYFFKKESTLFSLLGDSKYGYTAKALKRFYLKNNSLSNTIQGIDYENDRYSCFPLIRCQIEHFLVSFYIWLRFRIDENDETAKRYYEEYLIQEFIKRSRYTKSNNIPSRSRYVKALFIAIDKLKSEGRIKDEQLKDFNKIDRQLNEIKNEFSVPKISEFLDEKLPEDITPFLKPKRAKQLLEDYNYLSSFIHGGPSSDISLYESNIEEMKLSAFEYKDWSINLMSLQRFYIIYFLAYENDNIKTEMQVEIEKIKR